MNRMKQGMPNIRLLTKTINFELNYFRYLLVPHSPPSWSGLCYSCLSLRLTAVDVLLAFSQLEEDSRRCQGGGSQGPVDLGIRGTSGPERT